MSNITDTWHNSLITINLINIGEKGVDVRRMEGAARKTVRENLS
jgi:hypothetical protein